MTYDRNLAAYQETRVLSSSPEQLVPLLYEHLLVNLKRAARQIQEQEIEAKADSVEKATAILYELLSSLDFDAGGEIASRLASLYSYFLKEVGEASRALDARRLQPLIQMVGSLHESWLEAARIVSAGPQQDGAPFPADSGEGAV
jgi:flagellar protein FliS